MSLFIKTGKSKNEAVTKIAYTDKKNKISKIK